MQHYHVLIIIGAITFSIVVTIHLVGVLIVRSDLDRVGRNLKRDQKLTIRQLTDDFQALPDCPERRLGMSCLKFMEAFSYDSERCAKLRAQLPELLAQAQESPRHEPAIHSAREVRDNGSAGVIGERLIADTLPTPRSRPAR